MPIVAFTKLLKKAWRRNKRIRNEICFCLFELCNRTLNLLNGDLIDANLDSTETSSMAPQCVRHVPNTQILHTRYFYFRYTLTIHLSVLVLCHVDPVLAYPYICNIDANVHLFVNLYYYNKNFPFPSNWSEIPIWCHENNNLWIKIFDQKLYNIKSLCISLNFQYHATCISLNSH